MDSANEDAPRPGLRPMPPPPPLRRLPAPPPADAPSPVGVVPPRVVLPTPAVPTQPSTDASSRRTVTLSSRMLVGVAAGTVAVSTLMGAAFGHFAGGNASSVQQTTATAPIRVDTNSNTVPTPTVGVSPGVGMTIAEVARQVSPSVVQLEVVGVNGNGGTGSGFVVRDDGYIVTNAHVATAGGANADILVYMPNGDTLTGSLVGYSTDYDLAVVKVDKESLPSVPWAPKDEIQVGSPVVALGSPLGLQGTVTSGIVSALDRPVIAGSQDETSFINAIQTDAAINPGNSGGPLVNTDGEVVGVNSAIASLQEAAAQPAGSIGLGFAIPSGTASRVVDEIIEMGRARTPWIGVSLSTEADGAHVADVSPGGPAESAGLQPGDHLVGVDGQRTRDATSFIVALREFAVGDDVEIEYSRDGRKATAIVTLAEEPV